MREIRQFEEERKAWQKERSLLEERQKALSSEKEQVDGQLAQLRAQLEQLRAAQATPPAAAMQRGPVEPAEHVRSRHELQLALMAKIDELRSDLQQEQQRSRALEQRAAESEKTVRRLTFELERAHERTRFGNPLGTLNCSVWSSTTRATSSVSSIDADTTAKLIDTIQTLETSRRDVASLEEESLRLREELNTEKQKVIELKHAGHTRAAAWKEELQKITEDLVAKQRLEEEVVQLRSRHAGLHEELGLLSDREAKARKEAARLQREVQEASAAKREVQSEAAEEMHLLSSVVGSQLVAVEQELTQQTTRNSQRLELFLHHACEPLARVRHCCWKLAYSGAAGSQTRMRAMPSLFEANAHDLHGSLRKIVDLLRFVAEVLEAHERQREGQQQPLQGKQEHLLLLRQCGSVLHDCLDGGEGDHPGKGETLPDIESARSRASAMSSRSFP